MAPIVQGVQQEIPALREDGKVVADAIPPRTVWRATYPVPTINEDGVEELVMTEGPWRANEKDARLDMMGIGQPDGD
jgi:hypothetical protein